jgi:alpha-D-ribose 1-methylphosphonate 5-triphosphate diphosphatase
MTEQILTNARIVTAETVIENGTMIVAHGRIVAVAREPTRAPGAVDCEGDYLLPGLIELHTDNLEKHFAPRPGVRWPADNAVIAHDAQLAACGITTVFDAVAIGDIGAGGVRVEALHDMLDAIRRAQSNKHLRAEHLLHIRCEVSFEATADLFRSLAGTPLIKLVSIMDHTPGQRQFVDPDKLKLYYTKKHGMSDAEFSRFCIDRLDAHQRFAARHRKEIVALAQDHGYALASHDDATPAHVEEAVADGMTIAEFPTTIDAARASHGAGLAVLVGGPNIVLGGSHSGNISAAELVESGVVDIISSDYVPSSLAHAIFAIAARGIGLPAAARMASFNPARAVGLDDRGELAAGKRADWIRVRPVDGAPVIRDVWREGRRIA